MDMALNVWMCYSHCISFFCLFVFSLGIINPPSKKSHSTIKTECQVFLHGRLIFSEMLAIYLSDSYRGEIEFVTVELR